MKINNMMIRRIDDLGRLFIPKEIRREAKIREGNEIALIPQNDGTILLIPRPEIKVGEPKN